MGDDDGELPAGDEHAEPLPMLPKRLNECADHSEPGELSPSDVFAAKSSFGCSALGFGDAAGAAAAGSGSVGAVAAAG